MAPVGPATERTPPVNENQPEPGTQPEAARLPKPVLLPTSTRFGEQVGQIIPLGELRPVGASLSSTLPEGKLSPNDGANPDDYAGTFYAQVGGRETFAKLAERFYAGVAEDLDFRAMYPEQDLRPATMRLQLFLEQYWGGPSTYNERRGHPRLRMRHQPYTVNPHNRDVWLKHMKAAVESLELPPLQEATLWDYFDRAAHSLQNASD